MSTEAPTREELEEKYGPEFADHYLSIDWGEIDRTRTLGAIGKELYAGAMALEAMGVTGSPSAIVASIMDFFQSSQPRDQLTLDDELRHIAHGYGAALIMASAQDVTMPDDEDEEVSL